jgi:universal stress protein E
VRRFQRILVGIDLSLEGDALTPGSARAAEQALWLAAHTGAELAFLHSTWSDIHEEDQAIRPGPSEAGVQSLEQLVARARKQGSGARLALVRERAWMELIRAVQRGEGDLVIVARRNQLDGGALIGGVARKLMRKCPCPVWVVKPEAALEPRVILAATDLSLVGNLAVELAALLAQAGGGELHVVHAWQPPSSVPLLSELETPAQLYVESGELERTIAGRFQDTLQALGLPVQPRTYLECAPPSQAIRARAQALGADLLVMGTVSRGGIAGFLVGNTAERLLDRVECSLLTIKPSDFVAPLH